MEKEVRNQRIEDIVTMFQDVLKCWWVILCVSIGVSLWAYIGASFFYHPQYTSSTTFVVSAKASSTGAYANLSSVQKLTDTFQSVLDSDVLKKKVAEALEMKEFEGEVGITIVDDTNLLTLSVTSDAPDVSFKELKGILENYEEVSKNVLGEVVMETFEEPNFPSGPNNYFNGDAVRKKAFQIAVIVMILLLAMLSYQNDTVKSEEDVSEKLDTTLFGMLEHESKYRNLRARLIRKKKKILINEPSVSFGYVETIKKMRTKLFYLCRQQDSKVILVTSIGAGEGKTTVAANLALAMAQRGKRVLLIEGDLHKTELAKKFGLKKLPEGSGMGQDMMNTNLTKCICQLSDTPLYLLVNNVNHSGSAEILGSEQFTRFMLQMREKMDYIVIDAPSTKGRADAEILARISDLSLLVVKQNNVKVPYINDAIDMLNMYGHGLAGCVFNNVFAGGAIISSGYGYGYGTYSVGRGYGRYGVYSNYYNKKAKEAKKKDDLKAKEALLNSEE